jgi:hypothetical protein
VGMVGGILSIILWVNFTYINPYNNPTIAGPLPYPFFLLFIPACIAIFSSLKSSQKWMFLAFVWSLPMSLFMIAMSDIFSIYGVISVLYLVSFLLIRIKSRRIV